MKKKLIMITDGFPYGRGEKVIILPELPYLCQKFSITIISPLTKAIKEDTQNRSILNQDVTNLIYDTDMTFRDKILYSLKTLSSVDFWRDMREIICCGNNLFLRMINSLKFYSHAIAFSEWLDNNKHIDLSDDVIIYNVWCNERALGTCVLKDKYGYKLITRFLGYDLYNERRIDGRQCYRWLINQKMDKMFFEAENMREYYQKNFPRDLLHERCNIGRIGVRKKNLLNPIKGKKDEFVIVSCSNVIPLKRVDLIADAINLVTRGPRSIRWVHFGSGECLEGIRKKTISMMKNKSGLTVDLKGHVKNEEILKFYESNHVDCFITVTSTEGGVPVSLVEALSYGIPVIATDVADIRRTIDNNGFLLPETPTATQIAETIEKMIELTPNEDSAMRKKSLAIWAKYYDEYNIINDFVNSVYSM